MHPREIAYCGVFGAAALLLPVFFHVVRLGHVFMPMYLPLVTLAFFVRPRASALTALVVPILSGAVTGMPPFYPPVALVMAVELATMAAVIGWTRGHFGRIPVWAVLSATLIFGRLISVALLIAAARMMQLSAGFLAGISLLSGWPGLVLMMIVVPIIVLTARPTPQMDA